MSQHNPITETRAMVVALAMIFQLPLHIIDRRLMSQEIKSLDGLKDFIWSVERFLEGRD